MATLVSPGITITYQTPTGEWLTETELDCIWLELKGDWKREQRMRVGPALYFYLLKETKEYVDSSQWKIS